MKGAERFGGLRRLPGADTMLLGRRHMPWCDIAGEVFAAGMGNADAAVQARELR